MSTHPFYLPTSSFPRRLIIFTPTHENSPNSANTQQASSSFILTQIPTHFISHPNPGPTSSFFLPLTPWLDLSQHDLPKPANLEDKEIFTRVCLSISSSKELGKKREEEEEEVEEKEEEEVSEAQSPGALEAWKGIGAY